MKKTAKYLCALLALCMLFAACACRYTGNVVVVTPPTTFPQGQQANYNYNPNGNVYNPNQQQYNPNYTPVQDPNAQNPTEPTAVVIDPGATQTPDTQDPAAVANTDPATWSKQEILTYLGNAVTKTKAYTGTVSVTRSEDLGITVEEIKPNLPKLGDIANSLIKQFIKPVDEEIQFNGGQGQSDGEMIPLLLPKRQGFTLPIEGVAQAKAAKSGNNIVIDITLVPESTSMYDKPTYNSAAIGYLDLGSVDLGAITISSLNFDYKGSTIHAVILPNGYVQSAEYHIPLHVAASGKAAFISASFAGTGYQTEKWVIHW